MYMREDLLEPIYLPNIRQHTDMIDKKVLSDGGQTSGPYHILSSWP